MAQMFNCGVMRKVLGEMLTAISNLLKFLKKIGANPRCQGFAPIKKNVLEP
jgi:hypothetical protein